MQNLHLIVESVQQKKMKKNVHRTIFFSIFAVQTKTKFLMKKLYLFLGLIFVYTFLAVAVSHKMSKEKLEGRWNVKVTGAPQGYQDYIMEIKEDKGEYKADLLFVESKHKISNQTLALKDGKLTGKVFVDGENVDLIIWEEKGVVQGTAKSSSVGTLQVTFTRTKE